MTTLNQNSLTLCKVILYGLKSCDLTYNALQEDDTLIDKDKKRNSLSYGISPTVKLDQNDYLNIHVKPVANEEH
ncbi:unnamed protein product, partial [Didymodactylos carnosus]